MNADHMTGWEELYSHVFDLFKSAPSIFRPFVFIGESCSFTLSFRIRAVLSPDPNCVIQVSTHALAISVQGSHTSVAVSLENIVAHRDRY